MQIAATLRRLDKLETRVTSLEQLELLGRQLAIEPVAAVEREKKENIDKLQEDLKIISNEIHLQLNQVEQRLTQNERRSLTEEGRVTALVKSTQEIEKGILEGQQQLLSRRDEQIVHLELLRERLHQQEQRQLQLTEFSRQSQERFAAQVGRVREEVRAVKSSVETLNNVRINTLEHGHCVLVSISVQWPVCVVNSLEW